MFRLASFVPLPGIRGLVGSPRKVGTVASNGSCGLRRLLLWVCPPLEHYVELMSLFCGGGATCRREW